MDGYGYVPIHQDQFGSMSSPSRALGRRQGTRAQLSVYLTQATCIWDLLCADMKIRTAAIYPSISLSAGGKWPSRDH